jgi:hypothetical protein
VKYLISSLILTGLYSRNGEVEGQKGILQISVQEENVCHLVSREFKYLSLRAYVSRAGDSLTLLVLTVYPIPVSFCSNNLRRDEDLVIHRSSIPYASESAFFEYLTSVLIRYVFFVRVNSELESECAVLLTDSGSQCVSERLLKAERKSES